MKREIETISPEVFDCITNFVFVHWMYDYRKCADYRLPITTVVIN